MQYAHKGLRRGKKMKTDARIRYTKRVIWEQFFNILKTTPLNKVSIKDICDRAEINRATFYRYYDDAFDLMGKIQDELVESFRLYARDIKGQSIEKGVEVMLNAVKSNSEIYTILSSGNGDPGFISKIVSKSFEGFKDEMAKRMPALTGRQVEWFYTFIAQGCIAIVIDWVKGGMKESPAEVSKFVARLDSSLFEKFR
jgi:AcrR family transcriptional regulator